jgi:glycosyltransferase involved in cell wall biosynthesis
MTELPLVSIVTPAFNAARFLEPLLQSVAAQDYARIEHIVIDDGSNDGGATAAILQRYPNVRWWSRPNRGQYATMNEGLRAAAGEFITFISADDTYVDRGAVSALAAYLIRHPECDVAHGYTHHMNEDGTAVSVQPYQRFPAWMLRYNLGFIFHCSLLVRRAKLIADDLWFDESLRFVGDADWMIRLYRRHYRFGRIERCIGAYRHHPEQVSTVATGDSRAFAARLAERSRVFGQYGSSGSLRRLVGAYDTFHQRRVKLAGAWHRGGAAQVVASVSNWIRRTSDRESSARERGE